MCVWPWPSMLARDVIRPDGKCEEAVRAGVQQLPVSPSTCATACGSSQEVGRDDTDAQEQPLVDLAEAA